MSYQFHRWIITLGAQVRTLQQSTSDQDAEKIRRDVELYEAELQHLYAYASQQDIDLIDYYHPFAEIEALLLLTHKYLVPTSADTK